MTIIRRIIRRTEKSKKVKYKNREILNNRKKYNKGYRMTILNEAKALEEIETDLEKLETTIMKKKKKKILERY